MNATFQIKYTSDFDTDKNETYYACADIRYVAASKFTTQVPCFNVTADEFTAVTSTTATAGATATAGSSSSSPKDSGTKESSSGLSGGAIAGIVGIPAGRSEFTFLPTRNSRSRRRNHEKNSASSSDLNGIGVQAEGSLEIIRDILYEFISSVFIGTDSFFCPLVLCTIRDPCLLPHYPFFPAFLLPPYQPHHCTRCDGTQPGCKTCEVYGVECRYEKAPPMSQILAMAKRLQETEQTITELRIALHEAREANAAQHTLSIERQIPNTPSADTSFDSASYIEASSSTQVAPESETAPEQILLSDLSLDENGKVCNTPTQKAPCMSIDPVAIWIALLLWSYIRRPRTTTGRINKRNAAIQTDIPRQMISKLLQIHWTWIAPMFNWVYRPAFMLVVMCAHAAHFDDHQISELLISRARLLLGTEILNPSSIPTAQGLLQLSARELAWGSISQAWLYSGMAFRMAISLFLGLDDSAENDLWAPYYGDQLSPDKAPPGEYPPMKSHLVSSFQNVCKLAIILNDIILQLYSRRGNIYMDEALNRIQARLDHWREQSPVHLRCDPDNLPEICPPPHIIAQK
ncbi:unnamed protein product [Aspergillus oryzae RIB40]|uniref:DNA, SC111 n=1 Tax=Aspergillus oryzae (strain ATCC 42149 / RIB 40) TaxID=510516 RepID=Q2U8U1_ASPOR|nr:unnamed protein product [Aspergillus oryzae RIB40]BAE62024.1 unnamed protein product [Aspergillus oryzae RIB40]